MRNVYHYFNLQLSRLIALYIVLYLGYIYTPEDMLVVRHIMSLGLFAVMTLTILAALSKLIPSKE